MKHITKLFQERRLKLPRIMAVLGIGLALGMTAWTARAGDPPGDPPNTPMGVGKGIFPGRVVWVRDPAATPWDGVTGHWWDDAATDQKVVDQMTARSLHSLAGTGTDAESWDRLFKYFNRTHGRGDTGYRPTEGIAIKINCNNAYDGYGDVDQQIDASKQTVLALLRQLVNQAGVPQDKIVVYEAIRVIPDRIYVPCHAEFPGVVWMDSQGDGKNGRQPVNWRTNTLTYSAKTVSGTSIPQLVYDATYLINLALLKGHHSLGISLTAKNHYGSIKEDRQHWWPDKAYTPLVDLIGSKYLGGKTVLFMIDGLYGIKDVNDDVTADTAHWTNLFNGQWCASLFLSQDPVAIDSVGYDFLRAEFGNRLATDAKNNGNGFAMDAYLREAALADHPPSGTVYQPDGTRLASLGTHEHWNDATHKRYSRNLSTNGTGIELVSLLLPNPTASANKDGDFNVKDFGATGDGKTIDTDAINQAINTANAAGGGTVRFPAGTYLSASIRLKSNVTLQLEAGSTIEAVSEKAAPYDPPETNAWTAYQDFGHSHWHNSLIWGENIENVSIIGPGLIHGKGLQSGLYGKTYHDTPPGSGNKAISLVNCHNVTLRDFSILHGGFRHPCHRRGQPDDRQPQDRYLPGRHGHRFLPERAHRQLQREFPLGRRHLPESLYGLGCLRATETSPSTTAFVTGGYIEGTLLDGTFKRAPAATPAASVASSSAPNRTAISRTSPLRIVSSTIAAAWPLRASTAPISRMSSSPTSPCAMWPTRRSSSASAAAAARTIRRSAPSAGSTSITWSSPTPRTSRFDFQRHSRPSDRRHPDQHTFIAAGRWRHRHRKPPANPPKRSRLSGTRHVWRGAAYGFFIRHVNGIEFSDVTLRTAKEDLRPAFALEDVDGANFQNVRCPALFNTPSFVLKNVLDFNLHQCPLFALPRNWNEWSKSNFDPG